MMAAIALVFVAYSLTLLFPALETIRSTSETPLAGFLGGLGIVRRYVLVLFYYLFSFVLFWQRSKDRMALISSFMFLFTGTFPIATGIYSFGLPEGLPPFWQIVVATLMVSALFAAFYMILIYPDGRFYPPRSRWLLLVVCVLATLYAESFLRTQSIPVQWGLGFMVMLGMAIALQVHRYRHTTGLQKQQIKLFVLALSSFVVFQVVGLVLLTVSGVNRLSALGIIAEVAFFASYMLLLIILTLAVVRYRLWDVDFVINRSLVYGGLTVLLGIMFVVVFC